MTQHDQYVVGVDFGTLSGRAVVVRVSDGAEMGSAVHEYPHGVLEERLPGSDRRLPPDWALQVPEDYREVLRTAVPAALAVAGIDPSRVVGIGTDCTACTMVPTRADGTPLNEVEALADRPHAYVRLWKHHAAQPQADRVNALARERGEAWLARYGGAVSADWALPKALQLFEEDREVYDAMACWVEASDWVVWQLCGSYVRNACAAGYKGIHQDGAQPSADFLSRLAPGFETFVTDKLDRPIVQLGTRAGSLTAQAAAWTGLPEGIAVAVGAVDAHVAAAAAGAVEPGRMALIMGTSTCHVMSAEALHEVPGIGGVVDGGVVAGTWGYEAGQSAVGDLFAWFVRTAVPAAYAEAARAAGETVHQHLTRLAAGQEVGEHGLVALDWHGGNRSVLVDNDLSGLVIGQTLATRPEDVYRALVEATAFGTRLVVDTFRRHGLPVRELVAAGGLTDNVLLMQIYADVTRLPLTVVESRHASALGAAMHAAVAAGAHPDVPTAVKAMGRIREEVFRPDQRRAEAYDALFEEYVRLHDHFGRAPATMHRLRALRRAALESRGATSSQGPASGPPAR